MFARRTTERKEGTSLRERARRLLAERRSARAKRRFRTLRDVATGIGLVVATLAVLYVASDGAWPPLIAVESGSMMHATSETPYGRIGTVDVGDILLVRSVDDPRDVRTWAENGPSSYGRPGDVIAYAQDGDRSNTTIVHRAMAWVDVAQHEDLTRTYRVQWIDGKVLEFGDEGIYLPALGFDERFGFTPLDGYKPTYSGFITKGDNADTNPAADQAAGVSRLVAPAWVEGKLRGEIPWLGLVKLAFQLDKTNPALPGWQRVGNGFAPIELWTCLFVVLALLLLVPLAWDTQRVWRAHRHARRLEKAEKEAERQRRAEERERRGPVEFQPVTR